MVSACLSRGILPGTVLGGTGVHTWPVFVGRATAMRPSPQKGRPSKENPLTSPLPEEVLDAVSADEIDALQQLYTAFMGGGGKGIHISTQSRPRSTLVHVVFNDCLGSLGAICAAFASRQISISCSRAFTSAAGVALDTFHVSSFDQESEAVLRACLQKKVLDAAGTASNDHMAVLPESYASVTTPAEREAHHRLYTAWLGCGKTGVQMERGEVADMIHSSADVVLHLVFRDVEGALAVITAALAASGVNVKRVSAFCSPNGPVAIDTFQVDTFDPEAEHTLLQHLMAHLSEIEGDSQHSGTIFAGTAWNT